MASAVPTPRQFVTSLIGSLTSTPTPSSLSAAASNKGGGNPLKLIPPSHRPLLTTLYALYPLTLLPALDLLDRRLATRVIINPPNLTQDADTNPAPHPPGSSETQAPGATGSTSFYLVRSAQPSHPRRQGGASSSSSSSGVSYIVRLNAWNCTCAAFVFAAFPREESCPYAIDATAETDPEGAGEWQFGALSADGVDGSGIPGVPCCKHLLACVLAERWGGLLGGYVEERVVGREEGAGLVADI
ncbi:hypothetical protein F4677DRAFT_460424 [Hypoxylon crocopeplum]|nr:hypothetical protein F4677DRAFT_460424 [Hypoxylon crocopeplum]